MLGHKHFYHRTIRKVVVVFGTIFNDIDIVRFSKDGLTPYEKFKVPLTYAAKEKFITKLSSDPTMTKPISTVLPRMSFSLDSMSYDASRKGISSLQKFKYTEAGGLVKQYNAVPYDFQFSLSAYVRNTEDGTQIMEQILPFFTPDFTVTVDFIETLNHKYDMPIILNSVASGEEYEGLMDDTRVLTWDLQFTAKGWIWPPVLSGGLIRQANTNLFDLENSENLVTITTVPNPIDAEPGDDYGYTETVTYHT